MEQNAKARIVSFKRFEIHDGDGIRTTLFFKGCPLNCKWCHNPESISFQKEILCDLRLCQNCMRCVAVCDANGIQDNSHIFLRENCTLCGKCLPICPTNVFEIVGTELSAEEIANELFKDEIFMKNSGGGVTFSGGEPLMQPKLCAEIAKLLKEHNINIAIDSCGAVSRSSIDYILPYADTFLFDIKAIDQATHINCTGKSNKEILSNIQYVDSHGTDIEIRYPYVPMMNDNQWEDIANFVKTLKNVKCVRILPYHNYAEQKYSSLGLDYPLPDIPVPSIEEIEEVANKMRAMGLSSVKTD